MTSSLIIVGGGLAGFTAAQDLRGKGFDGSIQLIDAGGAPYDRPPLSKQYLAGEYTADELKFVPDDWFTEHRVELIDDKVCELDPDTGTVTLAGGGTAQADVLLLATGGTPRRLPIPGGDDPGLLYLRTKADADALRSRLVAGHRLAIIGAGLIGAEVASTAVAHDVQTTLIDPMPIPGLGLFGPELGAVLHEMHAERGVRVKTAGTRSIEHSDDGWTVTLEDGDQVVADSVLVSIGIEPDADLASRAGLAVDRGVLVDRAQRSSHPKVFAAGDVARTVIDGIPQRRHEHWESAMHEGQTAAAGILGVELPEHGAPWMWSDRHGVHVEVVGDMTAGAPALREVDGRPAMAFRLAADGRMLGAAAIDGGVSVRAARRIIDRRIVVDPAQLADPAVALKKLMR